MEEHETSSLRSTIQESTFSCCFKSSNHRRGASFDAISSSTPSSWSPRTWIRSKTIDPDHNKVTSKSRNFISHMRHFRRNVSADFSYDPLSYSLNFEEESLVDDFQRTNFVSRLPASPPRIRGIPRPEMKVEHEMAKSRNEVMKGFEALQAKMERGRDSNTKNNHNNNND